MNMQKLIDLALGPEEGRKVDTAIPQDVFDRMTQAQRDNRAGWYYDANNRLFGRLLTKDECWREIIHKVKIGKIEASICGVETPLLAEWPCFRSHCERGEIQLEEIKGNGAMYRESLRVK